MPGVFSDFFNTAKLALIAFNAITILFFTPISLNKNFLFTAILLTFYALFFWRYTLVEFFFFPSLFLVYFFSAQNLTPMQMNRLGLINLCTILVYSLYGLLQFISIDLFMLFEPGTFSSFFANNNMAAEYISLSIFFSFALMDWQFIKKKKLSIIPILFIVISYTLLLGCRSITLALFVTTPIVLVLKGVKKNKKLFFSSFSICIAVLAGLLISNNDFSKKIKQEISDIQTGRFHLSSTGSRLHIWKASFLMAGKNPFGVGPQGFESKILPLQKKGKLPIVNDNYFDNPHNEFIRFFVEAGPILTLLFLIVLFLNKDKILIKLKKNEFLLIFSIFLSVHAFFQFPFQNAYPLFAISIILGIKFKRGLSAKNSNFHKILLFILFVPTVFIKFSAEYTNANSWDYKTLKAMCQLAPNYWFNCIKKSEIELESNQLEQARSTLTRILKEYHLNPYAIRYMAILASKEGNLQEECHYLYTYDDLIKERNDLHDYYLETCK